MKVKHGETVLRINISFAAVVTFMLILDDSGICALSLFCCIVHEVGHLICLSLLGEKPALLELSFYGIKLERKQESFGGVEDILVFLSGPAANLVLSAVFMLFSHGKGSFGKAAAVSTAVGLFNLIPCRPLDGGNVIYAFLCRNMNEAKAFRISFVFSLAVIILLGIFGAVLALGYGNFTLMIVDLYLAAMVFLNKKEKNGVKM